MREKYKQDHLCFLGQSNRRQRAATPRIRWMRGKCNQGRLCYLGQSNSKQRAATPLNSCPLLIWILPNRIKPKRMQMFYKQIWLHWTCLFCPAVILKLFRKPAMTYTLEKISEWQQRKVGANEILMPLSEQSSELFSIVRRDPDRIGLLKNPQQSSIRSPPRASSRTGYPTFPTRKYRYEAIQVWLYTTFISCRSWSWDNLRVKT
jgi:hypothetical protein